MCVTSQLQVCSGDLKVSAFSLVHCRFNHPSDYLEFPLMLYPTPLPQIRMMEQINKTITSKNCRKWRHEGTTALLSLTSTVEWGRWACLVVGFLLSTKVIYFRVMNSGCLLMSLALKEELSLIARSHGRETETYRVPWGDRSVVGWEEAPGPMNSQPLSSDNKPKEINRGS